MDRPPPFSSNSLRSEGPIYFTPMAQNCTNKTNTQGATEDCFNLKFSISGPEACDEGLHQILLFNEGHVSCSCLCRYKMFHLYRGFTACPMWCVLPGNKSGSMSLKH